MWILIVFWLISAILSYLAWKRFCIFNDEIWTCGSRAFYIFLSIAGPVSLFFALMFLFIIWCEKCKGAKKEAKW